MPNPNTSANRPIREIDPKYDPRKELRLRDGAPAANAFAEAVAATNELPRVENRGVLRLRRGLEVSSDMPEVDEVHRAVKPPAVNAFHAERDIETSL